VKLGRFPFAVSAISVNWLTTSAAPVETALRVREDPEARDTAG